MGGVGISCWRGWFHLDSRAPNHVLILYQRCDLRQSSRSIPIFPSETIPFFVNPNLHATMYTIEKLVSAETENHRVYTSRSLSSSRLYEASMSEALKERILMHAEFIIVMKRIFPKSVNHHDFALLLIFWLPLLPSKYDLVASRCCLAKFYHLSSNFFNLNIVEYFVTNYFAFFFLQIVKPSIKASSKSESGESVFTCDASERHLAQHLLFFFLLIKRFQKTTQLYQKSACVLDNAGWPTSSPGPVNSHDKLKYAF